MVEMKLLSWNDGDVDGSILSMEAMNNHAFPWSSDFISYQKKEDTWSILQTNMVILQIHMFKNTTDRKNAGLSFW